MREIYSAPTRLKQLAGITGGVVLALSMSLPGTNKNESSNGDVESRFPKSAWGQCDPSLWEHVHGADIDGTPGPDRLEIIEPCKKVSGTITAIQAQSDGDLHILLRPDPAFFQIRLDHRFQGNIVFQDGNLVTEPVCAAPVMDQNVREERVCDNFSQDFDVEVGQHVEMTGSYVLDKNPNGQHGWLEIHPITSIRKN